jgi:uncharacterized membrane protein
MRYQTVEITRVGIFAAIAVTGGYLFAFVPNLEIYTASIFLSGVLLGKRNGVLVALVAQLIYGLVNPYGTSPLPLLIIQIASYILIGYSGGCFSAHKTEPVWISSLKYGVTGLLLTLQYDVLTFVGYGLISGFSIAQMQSSFWAGFLFYIVHWAGNALIFAFVLPLVLRGLTRIDITRMLRTN